MPLDAFDHALLAVVQENNRLPNREIADRVCLSETAVRRRLDRMRADGVITADVSLVDRNRLAETLIVAITMKEDAPSVYATFRDRMQADAAVSQLYTIAGAVDFIIHVHAPSLTAYERWAEQALLADNSVARYETSVVFTTVKFDTAVRGGER